MTFSPSKKKKKKDTEPFPRVLDEVDELLQWKLRSYE